jgi:hypothetical protein
MHGFAAVLLAPDDLQGVRSGFLAGFIENAGEYAAVSNLFELFTPLRCAQPYGGCTRLVGADLGCVAVAMRAEEGKRIVESPSRQCMNRFFGGRRTSWSVGCALGRAGRRYGNIEHLHPSFLSWCSRRSTSSVNPRSGTGSQVGRFAAS